MGRWGDGEMGGWEDGEMGGWEDKDTKIEYKPSPLEENSIRRI